MATARRDKTYDPSIVLAVLANVDALFCLDQYFCSFRQKSLDENFQHKLYVIEEWYSSFEYGTTYWKFSLRDFWRREQKY